MILGLSHVAFGCAAIATAKERLAVYGYAPRFEIRSLENHTSKIPFLRHHQPQHDICALAADGAMAIELLDHGALDGPQSAALIPVFCSDAPSSDWQARSLDSLPIAAEGQVMLREAFDHAPQAFYDPVLSMVLIWVPADGKAKGLQACVLPTSSPGATASLLQKLRFRADAYGVWSLLTPVPALQARLIPVPAKTADGWSNETLLDMPGCACIAFMARGLQNEPPPVALKGQTVSFNLQIDGKETRITLSRPDYGPVIELVEHTK